MARILLAESDRRIRDFIAGILADFGHEVQSCGDGREASAWLMTGPIDVLVTDIVLRDSRTSSLGRCCVNLGIPAITLTGREFNADDAEADRPPPLLEKPFRFADLQSVLDAVAVYSRSTEARQAA